MNVQENLSVTAKDNVCFFPIVAFVREETVSNIKVSRWKNSSYL